MHKKHYVYILRSLKDQQKIYVGQTERLDTRLQEEWIFNVAAAIA